MEAETDVPADSGPKEAQPASLPEGTATSGGPEIADDDDRPECKSREGQEAGAPDEDNSDRAGPDADTPPEEVNECQLSLPEPSGGELVMCSGMGGPEVTLEVDEEEEAVLVGGPSLLSPTTPMAVVAVPEAAPPSLSIGETAEQPEQQGSPPSPSKKLWQVQGSLWVKASVDEIPVEALEGQEILPSALPDGLPLSPAPRDGLPREDGDEPDDDLVLPGGGMPLMSLAAAPMDEASGSGPAGTSDANPEASRGAAGGADSGDPGDPDPGARARDLISRDLLDELSHEPDDWNEGGNARTPPLAGFETPSEPRTPSPRDNRSPHFTFSQNHEDQTQDGMKMFETMLHGKLQDRQNQASNEGMMCIDQWDWKTDAPEFVPGSMKAIVPGTADGRQRQQQQVVQQGNAAMYQGGSNTWTMSHTGGPRGDGDTGLPNVSNDGQLVQLRAQFEWQLRSKSDELREMQNRMNQLEIETAQVRASWEMERRNLVRQIGHYRAVLERYCIPLEEASNESYNETQVSQDMHSQSGQFYGYDGNSQWGNHVGDKGGMVGGSTSSVNAGSGMGGFPGTDTGKGSQDSQGWFGGSDAANTSTSLDSKMRQLNNLLQEGSSTGRRRSGSNISDQDGPQPEGDSSGVKGGYSSGSIASTLRAMFPHATIRTRNEPDENKDPDSTEGFNVNDVPELDAERGREVSGSAAEKDWDRAEGRGIESQVRVLQRSTGGHIDERAMRALMELPTKEAKEALVKVDEVVNAQGGQCRNLSSILQSVCRKIEKKSNKIGPSRMEFDSGGAGKDGLESARGMRGGTRDDGARGRRARRLDEDGDAFDKFDSSGSDGEGAKVASGSNRLAKALTQSPTSAPAVDTPMSKRSGGSKSWADINDIGSGEEEDIREENETQFHRPVGEPDDENEYWTPRRVERAAKRGLELRRRGDHWELKISMGSLEPPLSEAGMERYCRWLRTRLSQFREEHGPSVLQRCRGEVDFSHNAMSNQMVWMLLETLAQHEVHAALLKLFANHISQGGVLAICEFIRMNERAEAVQELHLSHNEIDDESALELLRTLHYQRPRYPPRRPMDGTGNVAPVPVWLRLNHNRIRDPPNVLRSAEAEGITICTAWDRQHCGTSKCCKRECPLVHLYSFSVQSRRAHERPAPVIEDGSREYDANGDGYGNRRKRRGRDKKYKDGEDGEEPNGQSHYGGSRREA
eukprot:gnl/TRDRNA2_/TRDRNA2_92269_c0_seq1.p1 gnl/TRDRNA2_/TRDRNA2_92269_c0~~gnl/TRDRNA2_/TRDRNA2_92269_c0_seq1.p1  ORF type:complete len:1200 (-),score=224.92 gnl/TRDRNA2_/TRDRNA2_92269_c0_seq1:171-3770(-)